MPTLRSHLASLIGDFDRLGNEIAIVAPRGVRERRVSYRQVATLSRRFAAELQLRGIVKGDRVVLWGENSAEWVAAFFGCVLNGSIPVPLDAGSTVSFAETIAADVAAKLVLLDRDKAVTSAFSTLSLQDWPEIAQADARPFPADLRESDPLQIVFTSGTTGDPKGIVHTHRNVLASLRPIETEIGKYLRYERPFHPIRILHTLPLSHVFGQFMGLWIPALLGAEVHFQHRLVESELVDYIAAKRISVLAAVPRILDLLQAHLQQVFPDLAERLGRGSRSAWQRWWHFRDVHRLFGFKFWAFVCGGASLSASSEQFWNGLGFVVIQGYGMTETTALVSVNHPFKLARGTVGQILPGREVKLSPEGEVLVRGETISSTTWQDGEFRQNDSDWLATGDLGELDGSGNLRFRGRTKDVIVTASGLNIHPEDLEAALLRQPGVKNCAVIEAADEPEPLAVLVLDSGTTAADAIRKANGELAEFQQIRRWSVWPEPDLPRTSTGKVLRREITRRIREGEAASPFANLPAVTDIALDSLGRVQLQARLESELGIALNDRELQQVKTEEELQALIRRPPAQTRDKSAAHIYPRWPWRSVTQLVRSLFIGAVAMPLVRFFTKARVETRLRQTPRKPVLIVANHVTSYDFPFVLYGLPKAMRDRVAVATSGEMILDWRLARGQGHWFLNLVAPLQYLLVTALFNIFPLPQFSGFRRSFRHAGEAIDRGYSVLIFPEGRRSDTEEMQPFKSGAGLLWQELGVDAVPVRLLGLGRIKSEGRPWFRTGKIMVSTGALLPYKAERTPADAARLLEESVRNGGRPVL